MESLEIWFSAGLVSVKRPVGLGCLWHPFQCKQFYDVPCDNVSVVKDYALHTKKVDTL